MITAIATGLIVKAPELKHSVKGTAYLKFTIQTSPSVGSQYGKKVQVTVFGNLATALSESLRINQFVSVTGTPQANGYSDNQGKVRGILEVIARDVAAFDFASTQEDDVPL